MYVVEVGFLPERPPKHLKSAAKAAYYFRRKPI
jgi:hypothetical protein